MICIPSTSQTYNLFYLKSRSERLQLLKQLMWIVQCGRSCFPLLSNCSSNSSSANGKHVIPLLCLIHSHKWTTDVTFAKCDLPSWHQFIQHSEGADEVSHHWNEATSVQRTDGFWVYEPGFVELHPRRQWVSADWQDLIYYFNCCDLSFAHKNKLDNTLQMSQKWKCII